MFKKSPFVLMVLFAFFIAIYGFGYYYTYNLSGNHYPHQVSSSVRDISEDFRIIPKTVYSLRDKNIVIPQDTHSVPGISERIKIEASYDNEYANPLWGRDDDCNFNGYLEKKTLLGWYTYAFVPCNHLDGVLYKPTTFYNNGKGTLSFYLFTRSLDYSLPPVTIRNLLTRFLDRDVTRGTYRVVRMFFTGCKADKDLNGGIFYKDCTEELVSYSPEFLIVD